MELEFSEFRRIRTAAAIIALGLAPFAAQGATLSDLIAGGSLVQGDVTFSNFVFNDRFLLDFAGDARTDTPFAGDRPVAASEVEITTSSTAGTVSLTASIDPAISITGIDPASGLEHLFDFYLDFSVAVTGSARTITAVSLGGGDLFATGANGFSEVVYDDPTGTILSNLEIFEDAGAVGQTSDTQAVAGLTMLDLEGAIQGETHANGTSAGLSTFTITFDLAGDRPPDPNVVPVPASLPLLLGAMAGFGILRRRRG